MSFILIGCSNDQENDFSTDTPQNSKQQIQAVIGETKYTFDSKEQLKAALEEKAKEGEILKSVKILNGVSTRAAGSTFTFTNGTGIADYTIGEGELTRNDWVDVSVISRVNGNVAGFKMYSRPTWAYVTEYDNLTYDVRRLQANANIEGGERSGCVILEQVGTGEWIFVNITQKGSPRSNIFHCAGTKNYFFYFSPAGGSLTSESIVSTINGTRAKYTSINPYNNNSAFVEDKLYPNWISSIMGIGTNQLVVIVKPDPTLNLYSAPKETAFNIFQAGTNEYIGIWISQSARFSSNYTSGGYFTR